MLCPWATPFFQKLCPAPFPPVSRSFLEMFVPQCCLYNLLEGQPENNWPLGGKYCIISNPSRYSGLHLPYFFFATCATTTSLGEHIKMVDRHTMPARSPPVGISSREIGLPGISFAIEGVSPAGCQIQILTQIHTTFLLKLQIYPWIKSPLHFYGISGLLSLNNLFLNHLPTPTTRTLPPCRQH